MNKDAKAAEAAAPMTVLQGRIEKLDIVTMETPSLLNMVKHCHDQSQGASSASSQSGLIMGVLKTEIDSTYLLVTQTLPGLKKNFKNLQQVKDMEKDKVEINNEIGFYVSCQLGMAFT